MVDSTDKKAKSSPVRDDVISTFLKHRSALIRYISRFIHHPQDIEDIVHEAFLQTYAAEIKTHIHSPRAFLYKTAKNTALKHLDKCTNRLTDYMGDMAELAVTADAVSTESRVESQERFIAFCRAVRTLPLQCRRAFILRKVYGLSHKEIAEQLGISASTVEKHLANGIIRCSEYMQACGMSERDPALNGKKRGMGDSA